MVIIAPTTGVVAMSTGHVDIAGFSSYEERRLIMIGSEMEEDVEQLPARKEAGTEELLKRELWEHPEVLELVVERKKRKFIRSGLLVMLIGVILITSGHFLNTGANSIDGWIVGVGVIVELVGLLRLLIGLIRPLVPSQM
jgi:hypothetical protein